MELSNEVLKYNYSITGTLCRSAIIAEVLKHFLLKFFFIRDRFVCQHNMLGIDVNLVCLVKQAHIAQDHSYK